MSKKRTERLPEPKPTPNERGEAPESAEPAQASAPDVIELPPSAVVCPTCGTDKLANRCDVCGHQELDT